MKKQIAESLSGMTWPIEIPKDIEKDLRSRGLVAVYYTNENLINFRGFIHCDVEIYPYENDIVYLSSNGLILNCGNSDCPHEEGVRNKAMAAIKTNELDYKKGFLFDTDIPHEKFSVYNESGGNFCTGIIFSMKDLSTTEFKVNEINEVIRGIQSGELNNTTAYCRLVKLI